LKSASHDQLQDEIDFDGTKSEEELFERLGEKFKLPGTIPDLEPEIQDFNVFDKNDMTPSIRDKEDDNVESLPDDFTDMLDGQKSNNKFVYFSTLNSQDKQNMKDQEDLSEQKSQNESEENEQNYVNKEGSNTGSIKEKQEIHLDDMISYNSSSHHQHVSDPFQQVESYDNLDQKNIQIDSDMKLNDIESRHSLADNRGAQSIEQPDDNMLEGYNAEPEDLFEFDQKAGSPEPAFIIDNFEADPGSEEMPVEDADDLAHQVSSGEKSSIERQGLISIRADQLADYDEIFPVERIDDENNESSLEQISDIENSEKALSNINKSEEPLASIYGANANVQELKESTNNGVETFMKTDDLIDLFSIDPATGRAKYSDDDYHQEQDKSEESEKQFPFDDKELDDVFKEDRNPFNEVEHHKATDDFEFEFQDEEIRREKPIEFFNPSSIKIATNHIQEERHAMKMEKFIHEKWIERDISDTSSQKERTSIISSEANSRAIEIITGNTLSNPKSNKFFTRNSDSIHINSKQKKLYDDTSNQEIDEFIQRD